MDKEHTAKAQHRSKFKWLNWVIIVISVIAAVCYIVLFERPEDLAAAICSIRLRWLGMAGLMILLYWSFESCVLHIVTRRLYCPQKFFNTLRTTMVGQFYNCITPFASGGQPMQAYSMVKTGVPLGIAGSALLVRFIVYQFTLTVYSSVMLICFWGFFASKVTGLALLSALGFSINTLVMVGLFCIGFAKNLSRRAVTAIIRFLAKIHIVKQPEEKIAVAEEELTKFYEGFRLARKNIPDMLGMLLFSFLQLTAFFLIPYFLCLAFRVGHVSLLQVVAAQAFVAMLTSFVPLPGAAGGAEISFVTFFAIFMKGSNLKLSMLLWRMLTFYAPIVIGGIFAFGCTHDSAAYLQRKEEQREQLQA